MANIIKTFREILPDLRFIGKRYGDIGHWGEWWQNDWFDEVEKAMGGVDKVLALWENGGAYVGLERRHEGNLLAYWLGMFAPAGTPVPEGFEAIDFKGVDLGTCWIYGPEGEVHDTRLCRPSVLEAGFTPWKDAEGSEWSFENCTCPRYTTPDERGNVVLDYCFFVEK